MKNNTPISQVIKQLQSLSDPEQAKELIEQFSAGLKENGIEIPQAVFEMPEEVDRILHDTALSVRVGKEMEIIGKKMQTQPSNIQEIVTEHCQKMMDNIDELEKEVAGDTYENAKRKANQHIRAALKNIQIGRK